MHRWSPRWLLATLPLLAAGCGDSFGPITELPRKLGQAELSLIEADNRFATVLFRAIADQADPDENLFVSPLSVSMALGMVYNGAAGETRTQMANVLGFGAMELAQVNQGYRDLMDLLLGLDPRVTMEVANSVWHRPDLQVEAPFVDAVRQFFSAEVRALDFGTANAPDVIDGWVHEKTHGRIATIAPRPIPPELVMFLINAMYFKGDWTHQFDKSRTSDQPFQRADGSQIAVPTMRHEEDVPVRVSGDQNTAVLEMGYGGGAFTMVVAVPREGTLDDLVAGLDREQWEAWTAGLDSTDKIVVMPKFTFEYSLRMDSVLAALGMDIAFDPNRADFTGINRNGGLYIDRVQHKTFVAVDEEGTEAAAVTSVGIGVTSAPLPFVIDRPFLFAIRERFSGAILFIGRIVDPRS